MGVSCWGTTRYKVLEISIKGEGHLGRLKGISGQKGDSQRGGLYVKEFSLQKPGVSEPPQFFLWLGSLCITFCLFLLEKLRGSVKLAAK